jgi:hypothetical protein
MLQFFSRDWRPRSQRGLTEPYLFCLHPLQIVRTWTSIDSCDNEVSASQVITLSDTKAPVLSGVPESTTAECGEIPPPPTVTGTDACSGAVDVTNTTTVTPGVCAGTFDLLRQWTATDACNLEVTKSQLIAVSDTKNPVLDGVPESVTVSCDNIPALPDVTSSDVCDGELEPVFNEDDTRTEGACTRGKTVSFKPLPLPTSNWILGKAFAHLSPPSRLPFYRLLALGLPRMRVPIKTSRSK